MTESHVRNDHGAEIDDSGSIRHDRQQLWWTRDASKWFRRYGHVSNLSLPGRNLRNIAAKQGEFAVQFE
jgi:hypothetical protein